MNYSQSKFLLELEHIRYSWVDSMAWYLVSSRSLITNLVFISVFDLCLNIHDKIFMSRWQGMKSRISDNFQTFSVQYKSVQTHHEIPDLFPGRSACSEGAVSRWQRWEIFFEYFMVLWLLVYQVKNNARLSVQNL